MVLYGRNHTALLSDYPPIKNKENKSRKKK